MELKICDNYTQIIFFVLQNLFLLSFLFESFFYHKNASSLKEGYYKITN